jgi:hypothetical protein
MFKKRSIWKEILKDIKIEKLDYLFKKTGPEVIYKIQVDFKLIEREKKVKIFIQL